MKIVIGGSPAAKTVVGSRATTKTVVGGHAASGGRAGLCDLLDRLIDTGVVARGSLVISVAGIALIYIEVSLLVASIETAFGERQASPRAMAA